MTAKELATQETATGVATPRPPRFNDDQIAATQFSTISVLPDLKNAQKHFMPLSEDYWSPQIEGEEKLVFICGIGDKEVSDMETGEVKVLECVLFIERQEDTLVRLYSASKVLVGNVKDAIRRGEIIPNCSLTPVSIKYLGQKKNKSNAKLSNRWQIIPLIVSEQ